MLDQQMTLPGWRGGDGDASYLDKTLRHIPMEVSLDESVAGAVLLRFWGRAAGVASIWFFFFLFVYLASGDGPSAYGSSGGGSGLLTVASLGSFIIFWLVFLLSRLQEPIGEWRVLLSDRAPAKPHVYSQIHGRLRDRGLPISYTPRRIRTGLSRDDVGDRVILVDGHYFAYISVFEYGSSLYLGWMMWRERRGATLVARFIADVVAGIFGKTDPVRLMLRTERPRAMREAVHSVCREGLHVAVENLQVPETYGFPSGLPPVEEAMAAAAAAPKSAPVSAAMPMPAGLVEEPAPAPEPVSQQVIDFGPQYQQQYEQQYQQQYEQTVAYEQQVTYEQQVAYEQPMYPAQQWDTGQQPVYDPAQYPSQQWDTGQQPVYFDQMFQEQPPPPQQADFFHRGDEYRQQ